MQIASPLVVPSAQQFEGAKVSPGGGRIAKGNREGRQGGGPLVTKVLPGIPRP